MGLFDYASKGGKTRAERMTPEERTAAAKKAAEARWAKPPDPHGDAAVAEEDLVVDWDPHLGSA